jgi:hypothetical protein
MPHYRVVPFRYQGHHGVSGQPEGVHQRCLVLAERTSVYCGDENLVARSFLANYAFTRDCVT